MEVLNKMLKLKKFRESLNCEKKYRKVLKESFEKLLKFKFILRKLDYFFRKLEIFIYSL